MTPHTDQVLPSTSQYRPIMTQYYPILTQYHQVPASTAPYCPSSTMSKYIQAYKPYIDPVPSSTNCHHFMIHSLDLFMASVWSIKSAKINNIENPTIRCFPKLHPFASFDFFGYLFWYIRIRKKWMANSNWNTLTDPNTTHLLSHTDMRADFPRVCSSELGSSWSD